MDDTPSSGSTLFPQWRVVAAVFAALTIGLGAWYYLAFRDDYAVLYSDVRPNDAPSITTNLGRHNIRYRLLEGGRSISVPSSQLEQARSALDTTGAAHTGDGFELFDQSDMGLNEFSERIRYQRAIQGELERTIMMMDGVSSARVHISMPERSVFRSEQQSAGAAVTVVMHAPQGEIQARVEGIQRLVAAAVVGISPSDVVVLNGSGEVLNPRVAITTISNALLGGGDEQTRHSAIDLVTQVMRQALPGLRFEVSIEQAQATAPGAGAATDNPIFTRIVKVATEAPLPEPVKQRVNALLHASGLTDGSSQQTVLFSVGLSDDIALAQPSPSVTPSNSAIVQSVRPIAASQADQPGLLLPLVASALGFLVIAGVGVFLWRRGAHQLPTNERALFAARLSTALRAHAEGDVA